MDLSIILVVVQLQHAVEPARWMVDVNLSVWKKTIDSSNIRSRKCRSLGEQAPD